MNYEPKIHYRKSIRLKEYDYRNANWYYITICTGNRINWFGKIKESKIVLSQVGKKVKEYWEQIPMHFNYCDLDYYVIMPNHLHGIIIINNHKIVETRRAVQLNTPTDNHQIKLITPAKNIYFSKISPQKGHLGIIIRTFKSAVKKYCNQIGLNKFNWQRNYYEHIIHNESDLYNIRKYTELNPLKWELDEYYQK
ncbi:MAG: transposase [Ignavibacteriaceae bacterium]|nr:transposase [Ignavibacteriaceae bacterium]